MYADDLIQTVKVTFIETWPLQSVVKPSVPYNKIERKFRNICLLKLLLYHYENLPMKYTETFLICKTEKIFSRFFFNIFLIFAQNIDYGYTLEPPRRIPTIYVFEQK